MQELMRHFSMRSTIVIYTWAVTPAKHTAQAAVLSRSCCQTALQGLIRGARREPAIRLLSKRFKGDGFEGAKRAPIRIPFALTNARRNLAYLIDFILAFPTGFEPVLSP
jgi:hypothetical protein